MASIRKHRDKWQVQIRRIGTPALSRSFINRKDAEAWSRQLEVQADRLELPKNPRELERHLLRDLVTRYRDTVTPKKRGQDVERIVLTAFLRHPVCKKRLSEISAVDFAGYRDERLKVVTPNTLRREFSPLHNMFETAKNEWGLPIKENPLDKVRLDCPNNRRERRLREGELERIKQAANKTKNPIILPVILFALQTGLRRSEILQATWEHLDVANRALRIPMTKNGHSRSIPLARPTLALLHSCKREGVEVRTKNEKIFLTTANAVRLAWDRLLKRAKIKDLHFHDLRHEAISRFFELGLTAPEVALLSGHRDMRMLFRYSHAQNLRVLEQLDRGFGYGKGTEETTSPNGSSSAAHTDNSEAMG